ncbi:hypothetical protein MHBO_000758 [Bonamia ostreae]|uniref:Uncharacterized protein n=1 Tax=Bonamia ostreae TaxID=126728 RepID=A0ABV2AHX9_9EUKA
MESKRFLYFCLFYLFTFCVTDISLEAPIALKHVLKFKGEVRESKKGMHLLIRNPEQSILYDLRYPTFISTLKVVLNSPKCNNLKMVNVYISKSTNEKSKAGVKRMHCSDITNGKPIVFKFKNVGAARFVILEFLTDSRTNNLQKYNFVKDVQLYTTVPFTEPYKLKNGVDVKKDFHQMNTTVTPKSNSSPKKKYIKFEKRKVSKIVLKMAPMHQFSKNNKPILKVIAKGEPDISPDYLDCTMIVDAENRSYVSVFPDSFETSHIQLENFDQIRSIAIYRPEIGRLVGEGKNNKWVSKNETLVDVSRIEFPKVKKGEEFHALVTAYESDEEKTSIKIIAKSGAMDLRFKAKQVVVFGDEKVGEFMLFTNSVQEKKEKKKMEDAKRLELEAKKKANEFKKKQEEKRKQEQKEKELRKKREEKLLKELEKKQKELKKKVKKRKLGEPETAKSVEDKAFDDLEKSENVYA